MKLSKKLRVIRIDPDAKSIASIMLTIGKTQEQAVREVKRVLRARTVGHREILTVGADNVPLMIAGSLDTDPRMNGFRFQGCEDHAGIGILFGKGPGGGMIDCPVDPTWVARRIVWVAGETPAQLRTRAEASVAILVPELRTAMLSSVDRGPFQAGDSLMWVGDEHHALFPALQQLGLTDEPSRGQRLSYLGDAVLSLLEAE